MKKQLLLFTFIISSIFIACEKDDDDDSTNSNGGGNQNPPANNLPTSYFIVENDTFYVNNSQQTFDPNAFRYQFNLSTKDQLNQTGNDGETKSTIGLVMTLKEKPSSSGQAPISQSRFQLDGSDSVNFYLSYFINTGSPHEGLNFLSETGGTLSFDITNNTFSMNVPAITLIDESGTTTNQSLNGGYVEVQGW